MDMSYFVFTKKVNNLFFHGLNSSTAGGLVGLCFFVSFFTLVYEAIKYYRHHLAAVLSQARQLQNQEQITRIQQGDSSESPKTEHSPLVRKTWFSSDTMLWMKFHTVQTLLHILQIVLGYMVMLAVMRFNAWLAIAVVLSSGVSYYVFGVIMTSKPFIVPVETNSSS